MNEYRSNQTVIRIEKKNPITSKNIEFVLKKILKKYNVYAKGFMSLAFHSKEGDIIFCDINKVKKDQTIEVMSESYTETLEELKRKSRINRNKVTLYLTFYDYIKNEPIKLRNKDKRIINLIRVDVLSDTHITMKSEFLETLDATGRVTEIINERKYQEEEKKMKYFLYESLSKNSKSYKYIDEVFNKYQEKYLESIKNLTEEFIKYKYTGSIIQENYFRKLFCIISDETNSKENIEFILKMTYEEVDKFIKKTNYNTIDIDNFFANNKKQLTDDEINNITLAIVILSEYANKNIRLPEYANKNINKSDSFYLKLNQALEENINTLNEKYKKHFLDYSSLDSGKIKELKQIQSKLKKEYDINTKWLPVIPFNSDKTLNKDIMTDAQIQMHFFRSIFDLEHINIDSLIGTKLKDKEVLELIECWRVGQENSGKYSKYDVDYENLYSFLIPAIYLRYMIRSYKESKDYFFENEFNEDKSILLKEKNEKITDIKQENDLLTKENIRLKNESENEINKLKEELRLLSNENKKLQQEINSYSETNEELYQLRNLMFNMNKQDYDYDENKSNINIELINSLKAICFGGSDNWINNMKQLLPDWIFISAGNENFDISLLKGKKYIFINTVVNSHSLYYKVINNKDKNTKLRYINSLNKDRVLCEIQECIKE